MRRKTTNVMMMRPINTERLFDITAKEENRFILQGVFAPVSLYKRLVIERRSFWDTQLLMLDRDAFVRDLRDQSTFEDNPPSP